MRSPTKACGSQPDPTKLRESDKQITLRKRKHPETDCSCIKNMADLRTDIMNLLQEFTQSQNENMTSLREDVKDIKTQIESIRSTTDYLVTEHNKILLDINDLKNQKVVSEQKIASLENEIDALKREKLKEPTGSISTCSQEDLIREINERSNREKNLIIVGIPELHGSDTNERRLNDEKEVLNIISSIISHTFTSLKTSRIGKYNANKDRSIKVYLDSPATAKEILKNKDKISHKDVKIFSDRTPAQQLYMKELKKELLTRKENGEQDLIIKYINGHPKIVPSSNN